MPCNMLSWTNPLVIQIEKDLEKLEKFPKWEIRFEIIEVYKGDKYADTAISELFFDGIDVH